jgi:diguanylate cyclase (GGDEF)-like protein
MGIFQHGLAEIRWRFHARWLVFGATCVVLAATLLVQLSISRSDLAVAKELIRNTEASATALLLNSVQHHLTQADWAGVFSPLVDTESGAAPVRLLLTRANGDILYESSETPTLPENFLLLVEKTVAGTPQAVWLPDQETLFTALPITEENPRQAAVFIRMVDHHQSIELLRQRQAANLSLFIAISLIVATAILTLLWVLLLRPLRQLEQATQTIVAGSQINTIPFMPSVELDQLGQSVNQMVEQISRQHEALEDLNRQLEERVKRRTGELQSATLSLKQRAVEMQSLNILMTAAFNAANLQELADHAVRDASRLMQANGGDITINRVRSEFNLSPRAAQLLAGVPENFGYQPTQEIFFHDWQSPTLPPRLLELGNSLRESGITSTISLPIQVGRETTGRLTLTSSMPNRWQERDLDLARIISRQLGASAERLQAFEDSQLNNRLMARLIIYSEHLNRNYNLADLVAAIGNAAQELTGVQQTALFLLDLSTQFTCAWQTGISPSSIDQISERLHDPQNQSVFKQTSPLLLNNLGNQSPTNPWIFRGGEFETMTAVGVLPLIYEQRASAFILVFYRQLAQWKRIELEIYQAFTRQAAIALENARLLEIERENRTLAEALRDVASALNSTLNANEVNDRILANLSRVVPHDAADIMMLEEDQIDIIHSRGYPKTDHQDLDTWPQPLSNFSTYSRIVESGQALVIGDTRQNPLWKTLPGGEWIRSWAAAPIRARSQVIGFVNICSRQPGFYNAHHGLILQTFADQASIAIENARLYAVTHRHLTEAGSLFRSLTPLLIPGSDIASLAGQFVHAVQREFNIGHCSMFILDEEQERLNLIQQSGWVCAPPYPLILAGNGVTVTTARTGQALYIPDVREESRYIEGSEQTRCELAIPFKAGARVLGVLNLEADRVDAFDEQTRGVLASLVEQASLVLENNFLLEDTQRYARQTEILNQITQISLQSGKSFESLSTIVEKVGSLLQAGGCYITAWEDATRQTLPLAGWGAGMVGFETIVTDPGSNTFTSALLDAGRVLAINDVRTSDILDPDVSATFPLPAFLGAPLIADGERLGAILVGFEAPHHFSRREIGLIEQASAQIALALAKMDSLALAQRQIAQSEKLRQATTALTTTLDFAEVVQRVKSYLPTLLEYDEMSIFEIQEHSLKPIAQHNIPVGDALLEMSFPTSDELHQEVTRTMQPLILKDAQADLRFKRWGGTTQTRSFLAIPLLAGNQMIGVLNIGRWAIQPFSEDELRAVRVFANQAGVAMQNALLHAELHEWAMTDPLTGLFNRRGFNGLARHEIERSRRFDRPLTVLMLDIDFFKRINDTHGHPVGDVVLQQLAGRFKVILREVDLICRYGGEEFCILLPESDPEGALRAAERILEDVHTRPFETRVGPLWVTLSIGLTSRDGQELSLEELLDQADIAMLRAKNNGRDRVCIYRV